MPIIIIRELLQRLCITKPPIRMTDMWDDGYDTKTILADSKSKCRSCCYVWLRFADSYASWQNGAIGETWKVSYQLGGKVLIVVKDGGEKLLARAFVGLYVEQSLHLACHGGLSALSCFCCPTPWLSRHSIYKRCATISYSWFVMFVMTAKMHGIICIKVTRCFAEKISVLAFRLLMVFGFTKLNQ